MAGSDQIQEIVRVILAKQRFIVTTHVRPDGDALGSLLAMAFMLRRLGKQVDAYCQDPVPHLYAFLPGADTVLQGVPPNTHHDAAILVDCGDLLRVGPQLAEKIRKLPLLINIDHHVSSEAFGHACWIESSASSTCEMLFRLFGHLPATIDPEIATQLYTGMLTDTGSFRFSNTNKSVLEIAAKLVDAGAEPAHIAERVFDSALPQTLKLLARVLSTVSFHADNQLATAELSLGMFAETSTTPAESEGFINHLRSVEPVRMAMMFREEERGVIHVSTRSKGSVDVAAFAKRHGGGGHERAAAFRVKGEIDEVRREFTRQAVKYLEEID